MATAPKTAQRKRRPKTATVPVAEPKQNEPVDEVAQQQTEPGPKRPSRPRRGRKTAPKAPEAIETPELVAPAGVAEPEPIEAVVEPEDEGAASVTAIQARVDCRVLLQAVEKVAVAAANSKGVPVLQSILIAADADARVLSLVGYDLSVVLQVEIQNVQIDQSGEFLVASSALRDVLSQMPDSSYLGLDSQSERGVLKISCAGIVYREQVSSTDNYPELPNLDQGGQVCHLSAAELAVGLSAISFMADPKEEKITNSPLLQLWRGGKDMPEDGFAVCTAQSSGMALYTVIGSKHDPMQPDQQFLLPPKAIAVLRKLCYGTPTVSCQTDSQGKLMRFTAELQTDDTSVSLSVMVRVREGAESFPRLRLSLPDLNGERVIATLDYRQFLEAVIRQEATQGKVVELTVSLDEVSLTTHGGQQGRQIYEQIGAENSGVGVIQVPIKMLMQACKGLECEQVQIVLDSQLPPQCRINDGQEHRLTLIFIDRPLVVAMARMATSSSL